MSGEVVQSVTTSTRQVDRWLGSLVVRRVRASWGWEGRDNLEKVGGRREGRPPGGGRRMFQEGGEGMQGGQGRR